jgi:uncharacterized protein YbjT (DUF2867 family)
MILVVGATGILGSEICTRLRREQAGVRALVRQSANRDRLAVLRDAGVELCIGDLKDPASLREACEGAEVVISTASSTLSRQDGDSIETVDRMGQLSLIETARTAGVKHFTLVSIPRQRLRESPLTRAKAEVERTLAASGLDYTILAADFFMEVWLSPALGFDVSHRKAIIFGDGNAPISWISYHDVAEFAIRSHSTPSARNQHFDIGGPQDLSPLDVVAVFEKGTGELFEKQFVPESALLAQLEQANDPLAETFLKLQLEYAHGCIMDSSESLRAMPLSLRTVDQYATEVLGRRPPAPAVYNPES